MTCWAMSNPKVTDELKQLFKVDAIPEKPHDVRNKEPNLW